MNVHIISNNSSRHEENERRKSIDSLDIDSEGLRRTGSEEDDMRFADERRSRKSSATFSDASTSVATVHTNDSVCSALSQLHRPAVQLAGIPDKFPRKKSSGMTIDRRSSLKRDILLKYSEMDGNYDRDANAPLAGRCSSATRKEQSESSALSSGKGHMIAGKDGKRMYSAGDVKKVNDDFNNDYNNNHLDNLIRGNIRGNDDMKVKAYAVMQLRKSQNREVDKGAIKQLSGLGNFQAQLKRCRSGGTNMRKRLEDEIGQQRALDAGTSTRSNFARPLARSLSANSMRNSPSSIFNRTCRPHMEDMYIDTSPLEPPVLIAKMLEEKLLQQQELEERKQKERDDDEGQGTTMEEIDTNELHISEKREGRQTVEISYSRTVSPKSPSRINVYGSFSDGSRSPKSRNSPSKLMSEAAQFGRRNSFTDPIRRGQGQGQNSGQGSGRASLSVSLRSPLNRGASIGTMIDSTISLAARESKRKYEFWMKVVQIISIRTLLSSRLKKQLDDNKEVLLLQRIRAANCIKHFYLTYFKTRMNLLINIMLERNVNICRPFKLLVGYPDLVFNSNTTFKPSNQPFLPYFLRMYLPVYQSIDWHMNISICWG